MEAFWRVKTQHITQRLSISSFVPICSFQKFTVNIILWSEEIKWSASFWSKHSLHSRFFGGGTYQILLFPPIFMYLFSKYLLSAGVSTFYQQLTILKIIYYFVNYIFLTDEVRIQAGIFRLSSWTWVGISSPKCP